MQNELLCFSLKDFTQDGGASIRITGILNALSKKDYKIKLFSIHSAIPTLNSNIEIIEVPAELKLLKSDKFRSRQFQFLLANLPSNLIFQNNKQLIQDFIAPYYKKQPFLFFEYLDISLGYWLFQNNIIDSYVTDVHGIAPLEFELNEEKSIKTTITNFFKRKSSKKLDRKVFGSAERILVPSQGLKRYFEDNYNINSHRLIELPESINNLLIKQEVDYEQIKKIKSNYTITDDDFVYLFAGAFKPLGGILDLIKAYIKLKENNSFKSKLILIGDGRLEKQSKALINNAKLNQEVIFLGRQPYLQLKTYQKLAHCIVCPDKDTAFSQLLPHIKYYDAITSGKIVINGNFQFTEQLNPNEKFSLNFEPSNINSLISVMLRAFTEKEKLTKKYSISSLKAIDQFNYEYAITAFSTYLNTI